VELRVNPYKKLSEQCACRIDEHIAESGFAKRHKRLMPFIESGVANRNDQSSEGPLPSPAVPLASHPMEHGGAEHAELRDMGQFSNSGVYPAQSVCASCRKEPVQEWN
jgi:hypothetical protein